MNVLQVRHVNTEIGQVKLLDDISFDLQAYGITALVGHNGAGKSTLMRTIIGELEKTAGEITINERYSQEDDFLTYKSNVSYLPEEPLLLTELTVMQHFQLYGMSYEMEEKVLSQRIIHFVSEFELEDKLDEYPESLSKGMRQKVQTICALLPDTPLLLIDEPFMGLDIYAMASLETIIREKAANGTGILLTSHQLDRIKDIADSFIMLQHGSIQNEGAIEDFLTIKRRSDDNA